jgi:lipopolysaccharide transport system permease protein
MLESLVVQDETDPDVKSPPAPAIDGDADDSASELVIAPRRGWRAIDLGELWRFRELLFYFTLRDVTVRYKQTVLGAAWAILQPVMTMVVFSIFFGRLGGMDRHTSSAYPIFVYAALLPWQFVSSSVTNAGQSLITAQNLISKVYFPRLIVPFSSVGAALVDLAISFCVMAALMVYFQISISPQLLLLPLCILGVVVAALGVGAWLSALTVAYRDFRYVTPFVIQIWMFVSPVAYPLNAVPASWRLAYSLNPLAGVIGGFRSSLLGEPIAWAPLAVSISVGLVLLISGAYYFRRTERFFADIV